MGSGAEAPSDAHRARIATGLRATLQSLGWIGVEAGIFRRLGLDASVPGLETGGQAAAAGLVRGDWEFAELGTASLVESVLAGHDAVILLAPTVPSWTGVPILTRRSISQPAQLAGARVGVLSDAGQTGITVRAALREWGVNATLVPLGTTGMIYAALGAGRIDAGVLPVDYRFRGPREFNLNVLDPPSTGFHTAVVGCTRRLIADSRPLVARLVQGYVETIHFFKTNGAAVLPLLQRFLEFPDRRAVQEAYAFHLPRFQAMPRPSAQAIQRLLDELAREHPAAATLSPGGLTDTSFLDDLERAEFVKKLYID
jgi:ABC-type nitrate/sulfonate/bicarbonate transport system substrate-binding protein